MQPGTVCDINFQMTEKVHISIMETTTPCLKQMNPND